MLVIFTYSENNFIFEFLDGTHNTVSLLLFFFLHHKKNTLCVTAIILKLLTLPDWVKNEYNVNFRKYQLFKISSSELTSNNCLKEFF
jgi:hypothetical protein